MSWIDTVKEQQKERRIEFYKLLSNPNAPDSVVVSKQDTIRYYDRYIRYLEENE
jgi:hypothetical protein